MAMGARSSSWRFFPWVVAGGMLIVVAVNVAMATIAIRSFPGVSATTVFDRSNANDAVLADAARQAALGWTVAVRLDGLRPVMRVTDRDGRPLQGLLVSGVAERPLGPAQTLRSSFHAAAAGLYVADVALDGRGQWDLMITAASDGHHYRTATRVVVP